MKSIYLIILFTVLVLTISPASAGSDTSTATRRPSSWSRFWHGVADDWKKIGKDAKENGVAAGRRAKKEVQQMPSAFRKGFEETRKDLKKTFDASKDDPAK
jgi:hypothetical protein